MLLSLVGLVGLVAWLKPGTPSPGEGMGEENVAEAAAAKEGVRWLTLQEAEESNKKLQKPILIDLYTDWCGWCKVMDKQTYANKQVAAYIMDKFYPVKLNAEQKQAIVFGGKTYKFNDAYRTHDFAIYLTQGQLSYPTTVILPGNGNMPQAIPGFLKPREIEPIVKYFGEGQFGKIAFDEYDRKLKKVW
jgi:thioredoxin-related protein